MKIRHLAIVCAAVVLVRLAVGQTPAELLQKGIYNQETVGDCDTAITIYRQITASKTDSHSAAQGQFRLGQCLLKKGDNAGGMEAMRKVVKDYPGEKELVAKAQEYIAGDLKLLPVPWSPNEVATYAVKLPGGQAIGTFIYSVEAVPGRAQNTLVQLRGYQFGMPQRLSRVEVDSETMRPVSSSIMMLPIIPGMHIDYENGQARVQPKGQEAKTVALDGATYDNEEFVFLSRRLPLAPGYKNVVPIMAPLGATLKLGAEVTGTEDVEVAAGKFRCYRMELKIAQNTFWIGVDAPHQLVKMDVGGATVELASVGTADNLTPVPYHDAKVGLSLTADPGWVVRDNDAPQPDQTSIQMLDPQVQATVNIFAKSKKTEKDQIAQQLQKNLEDLVKERKGQLKDYRLRPESVQMRQIGSQQVLSSVADFTDTEPMVQYATQVMTENSGALVLVRIAPSELSGFQKRFDPMINTIQLK
jgi:hypothetical protein